MVILASAVAEPTATAAIKRAALKHFTDESPGVTLGDVWIIPVLPEANNQPRRLVEEARHQVAATGETKRRRSRGDFVVACLPRGGDAGAGNGERHRPVRVRARPQGRTMVRRDQN